MTDPHRTLSVAAETLDPTRPAALVLGTILGHVAGHGQARSIVDRLMGALPPGSHLGLPAPCHHPSRHRGVDRRVWRRTGRQWCPSLLRGLVSGHGVPRGLDRPAPNLRPGSRRSPPGSPLPPIGKTLD
ncbi:SAM-dependent methyltransferase [Streptomyces rubradiris]|uniref:SAM-dependent methyltransferase n=1 Tax=Streptomyces rubradiris TaxID=285531 RepID=UPI003F4D21B7